MLLSWSLSGQLQKGDRLLTLISPYSNGLAADLGNFYYETPADYGLLALYPTYGFAVTDRIVLGATFGATVASGDEEAIVSVSLSPYARYYFLNRRSIRGFGEARTGGYYGQGKFSAFGTAVFATGVQLPIARNVLLTPEIGYVVNDNDFNSFQFGAGIELLLGRNNRPEARATAQFGRGSFMLGAQYAGGSITEKDFRGEIDLGMHYFLTDRLATGVGLQYMGRTFGSKELGFNSYGVGADLRYYLTTQRRMIYFIEAGGGAEWSRADIYTYGGPTTAKDYCLAARAGLQLFLRDNIALEAGPQVRRFFETEQTLLGIHFGARFFL